MDLDGSQSNERLEKGPQAIRGDLDLSILRHDGTGELSNSGSHRQRLPTVQLRYQRLDPGVAPGDVLAERAVAEENDARGRAGERESERDVGALRRHQPARP